MNNAQNSDGLANEAVDPAYDHTTLSGRVTPTPDDHQMMTAARWAIAVDAAVARCRAIQAGRVVPRFPIPTVIAVQIGGGR
jgi:hypothetical protein